MLHEIFKGMDNASELINENFEKTSEKKWTFVNLINGKIPASFEFKYRKLGEDTLQIYGRVDTTDAQDALLFTLPETHRPKHNVLLSVPTTTDGIVNASYVYIYTDGRVQYDTVTDVRGVHVFAHTIPLGK